jgi:hypothetical protein
VEEGSEPKECETFESGGTSAVVSGGVAVVAPAPEKDPPLVRDEEWATDGSKASTTGAVAWWLLSSIAEDAPDRKGLILSGGVGDEEVAVVGGVPTSGTGSVIGEASGVEGVEGAVVSEPSSRSRGIERDTSPPTETSPEICGGANPEDNFPDAIPDTPATEFFDNVTSSEEVSGDKPTTGGGLEDARDGGSFIDEAAGGTSFFRVMGESCGSERLDATTDSSADRDSSAVFFSEAFSSESEGEVFFSDSSSTEFSTEGEPSSGEWHPEIPQANAPKVNNIEPKYSNQ